MTFEWILRLILLNGVDNNWEVSRICLLQDFPTDDACSTTEYVIWRREFILNFIFSLIASFISTIKFQNTPMCRQFFDPDAQHCQAPRASRLLTLFNAS